MRLGYHLAICSLIVPALTTTDHRITQAQRFLLPEDARHYSLLRRNPSPTQGNTDPEKQAPSREREGSGFQASVPSQRSPPKSRQTSAGNRNPNNLDTRKRARTNSLEPGRSSRPRSQRRTFTSKPAQSSIPRSRSEMTDSQATSSSDSPSMRMLSLSSDGSSGGRHSSAQSARLARANIRLYGPGVTVVGGKQSYPEYSNIRIGETTSHQVEDESRSKAAGTTYEHEGGAVASAKGNSVKVTVDASRSKQGGRISSSGHPAAQDPIEVSPGSEVSLRIDRSQTDGRIIKIKGELYGKGSVMAQAEHIRSPESSPQKSLP